MVIDFVACKARTVQTGYGVSCRYNVALITTPLNHMHVCQICVEPSDRIASFFLEKPLSMHFVALILQNCFSKSTFFRKFALTARTYSVSAKKTNEFILFCPRLFVNLHAFQSPAGRKRREHQSKKQNIQHGISNEVRPK